MPNSLYRLIASLLAASAVACNSTTETPADAGLDATATDLGVPCEADEICADDDPCTVEACREGHCVTERSPRAELVVGPAIPVGGGATAIALADNELYIAKGADGLEIWDVALDPPMLRLARQREGEEGPVVALAVAGDRIVLGEEGAAVRALDRASGAPVGVAYHAGDDVRALSFEGGRVFVAAYAKGVEVLQPGDWSNPQRTARVDTPGRAVGLAREGSLIAVADGLGGLALIDLPEGGTPALRRDQTTATAGRVDSVALRGGQVLLAEQVAGLGLVTLAAGSPERQATFLLDGAVQAVALLDPHTGVAVGPGGVQVLDLLAPLQTTTWFAVEAPDAWAVHAQGLRFAVATAEAVQVMELKCPEAEEAVPDAGVP